LLLCALISYAVFVAPSRIGRMELEREAMVAATRIGAQLQAEPGTLIDAFARPALAPYVNRIFEDLGYAHRVLRYEVLTIPTRMSGQPDGTLIVYLDQSEQANALSVLFRLDRRRNVAAARRRRGHPDRSCLDPKPGTAGGGTVRLWPR
jgi:hypothetical protein